MMKTVSRTFHSDKSEIGLTRPICIHVSTSPTHLCDTTESDDNDTDVDSIVSATMDIDLIDCEFDQLDPEIEIDNYL